jgi:hypothetical protein
MKADLSPGEARPAAPDPENGMMAPRQPRRLGRRAARRRWDRFDDDEVFCFLSVLSEQDRRHQFTRGIEPERSLLAELERECRRRNILADDDDAA